MSSKRNRRDVEFAVVRDIKVAASYLRTLLKARTEYEADTSRATGGLR